MKEVFEKIIEKLEECKDIMISPKVSDCFEEECKYNDCTVCAFAKAIETVKQEAEKYNNGWIPCSERLPEDKQTCLVTARIYFTPDHVDEIDNYIGVGIDTYSKQFGWLGTEPIAWQPPPAPYQPKGEQ